MKTTTRAQTVTAFGLSPQLQKSLAILHAGITELRQLITTELCTNPALDIASPVEATDPGDPPGDTQYDSYSDPRYKDRLEVACERLAYVDSAWAGKLNGIEDDNKPEHGKEHSLAEHLLSQLTLSEADRPLAEHIIGMLDDHGMLYDTNIPELQKTFPGSNVTAVLRAIRACDPVGIASSSIQDCMRAQLTAANKQDSLAYKILTQFFSSFCTNQTQKIASWAGASADEVRVAFAELRNLRPYPVTPCTCTEYISPDVEVYETHNGDFNIALYQSSNLPAITISPSYRQLLRRTTDTEVRKYLEEKIRDGKFFMRSIEERYKTVRVVSTAIVARQLKFFRFGKGNLVPMTMAEIARDVKLHETTISRAANSKYLVCAHGLFPLKYFFTQGVAVSKGVISNDTIKHKIAAIIASETRPLPDDEIADMLSAQGMNIARRTVAKYRGLLNIPPYNQR